MFLRKLHIRYRRADGPQEPCPIAWIDNFAMRNFTNSAVFDDTLPVADGLMEVGLRVPLAALQAAMDDWFRRKGYLQSADVLLLEEAGAASSGQPPLPETFGSQ